MVALPYWYLYLLGNDVEVDFNMGAVETAIDDAGGPMGRTINRKTHLIHGREIDPDHPINQLPSSSGMMMSSVGKELSHEKYGQPKTKSGDEEKDSTSDETVT